MDIRERKHEIRKRMAEARRNLTPGERAERSRWICQRLQALEEWPRAKVLGAYWATAGEPDLAGAFHWWLLGGGARGAGGGRIAGRARRVLALPRVISRNPPEMRFYQTNGTAQGLVAGSFGILEPDPERSREVIPERFDWLWAPGVAFDTEGRRLGRGGAFYDAFLSRLPAEVAVIGVAFDWQILDEPLPEDAWDRRVHAIVTESRVLRFR